MSVLNMNWTQLAEIKYTASVEADDVREALARFFEWEPEYARSVSADELCSLAALHGDALDGVLADLEAEDAWELNYDVSERIVSSARPVVRPERNPLQSVGQGEAA